MIALTTLALTALGPGAVASGGNPHWIGGSGAINNAGNLLVNFKAAGLDGNQGITITARMSAAESMPYPNGGPLNRGSVFNAGGIDVSKARTAGTRTNMPHRP